VSLFAALTQIQNYTEISDCTDLLIVAYGTCN